MAITHEDVKLSGDRGYASEWNKDHVVTDESKPKSSTTFIIAASNSEDTSRADYVCDGTADEVQINQAISDLPATGGKISLLEGAFQTDATITINKNYVFLEGAGRGTEIRTSGNFSAITVSGQIHVKIENMTLWAYGTGAANNGIEFDNVGQSCISGCLIGNFYHNIYLHSTSYDNLITENSVRSGKEDAIYVNASTYTLITENNVSGNVKTGICLDSSADTNTIANNDVTSNREHGIETIGSSNNIILGNMCKDNDFLNTTSFDGIMIDNDSDRNIIASNRCLNNDRDEIRIDDANCDRNLIHGNICYGTDHVAAIVDNGTNTLQADNVVL